MSFRIVPLLLLVSSFSLLTATLEGKEPSEAEIEYGPAIATNSYEVLRKGKKIGTHIIRFYDQGDTLKVLAETNMKVKVLFITAFKYKYVSEETWQNGELMGVETAVNDNGKKLTTLIKRIDGGFQVNTDEDEIFIEDEFMTTNHWTKTVVNYDALLNTVTGDIMPVEINPDSNDEKRYLVRGKLNIDTFYNAKGDWLGMEFEHPKGGRIEFRCLDCENTPIVTAPQLADNAQAIL
ncbi:DUF6134 family protein [Kordiimonas sp. SCSIO 12610]|uniref:DUF6134 family protein n=1 Tax=Kordiimonas sp. SCSIO 12610 TaxID=2829597 RepID=UPI002109B093|nr:DUF6134 family protein [Kordiimonas sp. SCSIO 12610]UTW54352.1 hypothetical protein KFF44_11060 [Kordiimonas sp. SCSIO 12610]